MQGLLIGIGEIWKEGKKFPKSTVDFAGSISWQWLRSGYVKKNTEAIVTVAQNQALRTNWINANINGVDCAMRTVSKATLYD